jgi:hypothetical protein
MQRQRSKSSIEPENKDNTKTLNQREQMNDNEFDEAGLAGQTTS